MESVNHLGMRREPQLGQPAQPNTSASAAPAVEAVPGPQPRVSYETPVFQTYQDRRRAKLAAIHDAGGYLPPRRSALPDTSPGEASARCEHSTPSSYDMPLSRPTIATEEYTRSGNSPGTVYTAATIPRYAVERSDTVSSVRSLDRCGSPMRRPLPEPPGGVTASLSLDRGVPGVSSSRRMPSKVTEEEEGVPSIMVSGEDEPTTSTPPIQVDASETSADPVSFAALPVISITIGDEPKEHAGLGNRRSRSGRGGLLCAGCDDPIIGRTVYAMGRNFHPECFRCSECGDHLEHVSAYEWEDRAYCHLDYHNKFAYRCHHCQTPIADSRFITLDDNTLGQRFYHELHFFCSECGDPFLDPSRSSAAGAEGEAEETKEFVIQRGHPYCEKCHLRLHKPRCKACRLPIADAAISALNSKWHRDCFVCSKCGSVFPNGLFFPKDDKAFCQTCFESR